MKKTILTLILLVLIIFATGCEKTTTVDTESFNIVTSFYPMYIATSNLIKNVDNVSLKCLANPEVGCLHDYQLTVKDMMTLEGADTFIINGGGMESFLDKALSTYPNLEIVNASENVSTDENSHVWVSVDLHIKQVETICENLKRLDPSNANKYEENKNTYVEKLDNLKDKMHASLDDIQNKNIITFHEAFYYFAKEFGLNVVAVIEREPGTSPSAGELAEIIEKINGENASVIFVEPNYEKTAADAISKETGIPIYELDPVTSGTFYEDAYLDAMEKNLNVLLEALK